MRCLRRNVLNNNNNNATMTAQQYLLSQAEHCRRTAEDSSDPFVAAELQRLAAMFEQKARGNHPQPPDDQNATAA